MKEEKTGQRISLLWDVVMLMGYRVETRWWTQIQSFDPYWMEWFLYFLMSSLICFLLIFFFFWVIDNFCFIYLFKLFFFSSLRKGILMDFWFPSKYDLIWRTLSIIFFFFHFFLFFFQISNFFIDKEGIIYLIR